MKLTLVLLEPSHNIYRHIADNDINYDACFAFGRGINAKVRVLISDFQKTRRKLESAFLLVQRAVNVPIEPLHDLHSLHDFTLEFNDEYPEGRKGNMNICRSTELLFATFY